MRLPRRGDGDGPRRATRRSRYRAPGRVASSSPRARPCSTSSGPPSGATGSPLRRSLREPLHARVLPGRVRRGRPLARPLARCGGALEAAIEDFSRSRPAWTGGPTLGLAELRRRQGRGRRRTGCSSGSVPSRAAQVGRARMALDRGDARRAAELVDRVLRRAASGPAARPRAGARAARPGVRLAAASSSGRRARWRSSGRSRGVVGTEALRACADLAEGDPAGRPAATTSTLGPCSRTRSTDTNAAAPRSRPPPPGSSSPRASSRWVIPRRRLARRRVARDGLLTLGASTAAERAAATLAALDRAHLPLPELTAQGARGAAPARRGAHEPRRSPSAW